MRTAFHAALLATLLTAPAAAAEPPRDRPAARPPPPAFKTAKERLGGKHSDEQRADDCKVPPELRTRLRPTACPWDFGS